MVSRLRPTLTRNIERLLCYNKLWKLLIDKGWKRKDLEANAQVSHNVMTRLGKGQYIAMESMEKICAVLGCGIGDVMEFVSDKPSAQ